MKRTSYRLCTMVMVAAALPLAAMAASSLPGVGNFEKVNSLVFRGAQPTREGFQGLARLGVHTVIDLQEAGSARAVAEQAAVREAGMEYVNVPMEGMQTPSRASVSRVLSVLENPTGGPVFVHCHRGADRTGGIIACYRIEHDHWTNDKALSEARSMGMSWYQVAIQHFVKNYTPDPSTLSAIAPVALVP